MQDIPRVCTLTEADFRDRDAAGHNPKPFIRAPAAVPGGLTFSLARVTGLQDSLAELVRLEAECCPWMTFAMAELSEGIRLSVTSTSEEGERGVSQAFAPLAPG